MPELPEVETTLRGISPHIEKKIITDVVVRDHRLRWPVPQDLGLLVKRRKVNSLSRRGKYLILHFKHGHLILHLGMSGSLQIVEKSKSPLKHDHIDIVLSDCVLRFNDPRRFGACLWTEEPVEKHELLCHLGPEPLSDEFNLDYLFAKSRKRKQAIKSFIMDSKVGVGVGNIYANEALFTTGVRPTRPAGKITKAEAQQLVEAIKSVLHKAITQGGTTLRDFVGGDGKPGYFKQELHVYGRGGEACNCCQTTLKEIRLGQRSTVYCPSCQK